MAICARDLHGQSAEKSDRGGYGHEQPGLDVAWRNGNPGRADQVETRTWWKRWPATNITWEGNSRAPDLSRHNTREMESSPPSRFCGHEKRGEDALRTGLHPEPFPQVLLNVPCEEEGPSSGFEVASLIQKVRPSWATGEFWSALRDGNLIRVMVEGEKAQEISAYAEEIAECVRKNMAE